MREVQAIVLLGHGARDARWREPFDRLALRVATRAATAKVVVAFLEIMQPDLAGAIERLVADQRLRIHVVPVFLGEGGHVREDVPRLIDAARSRHPEAEITLGRAVGEDEAVLEAIAEYCVRG
jgi:sirohydrochlorin cobaltochelatase